MPSIRLSFPRLAPLPPTSAICNLIDLVETHHVVHGGDYGGETNDLMSAFHSGIK